MFCYTMSNGKINQFVDMQDKEIPSFMKDWLKTDDKIIIKTDGTFAFEKDVDKEQERLAILDLAKQAKINELKTIRDNEEVKPIEYNGNSYDFDEKARDRINSAIIALDITKGSIEWTTADNTNVPVNADDLRAIVAAVAVRSNELHIKYRNLKELVEAAESEEELNSINWE